MLPVAFASQLFPYIGNVSRVREIGGGCIAHASEITSDQGRFFLKWGEGRVAASFEAEAAGLMALNAVNTPLKIPQVIAQHVGSAGQPGWLLLEWIDTAQPGANFWEDFGRGLAVLHSYTAHQYGFEMDNWIGATPQQNPWTENWVSFFRDARLMPQVALAREQGYWDRSWNTYLDRLIQRLPEWLPLRPPASLLHGDLWSGNFMITAAGPAAVIDPAVYYGHAETDLAMSRLFGGFDARFYAAYQEAAPLEAGYETRLMLYNLYHILKGDGFMMQCIT